jgi:nucleoside-diphosphate-sugar epimerase
MVSEPGPSTLMNEMPPLTHPARILITGGAGFLGRNLCAALALGGSEVTVLDDLSAEGSSFDHPELRDERVRVIHGSTYDAPLLRKLIAEHEGIVHFASVVGVEHTMANPVPTIKNLEGTLTLTESLRPRHFVLFASSADVYGMHSRVYDRPMREDDLLVYDSSPGDRWTYARVKSLEETLVARSPARSVVARIFNTYGPRMDQGGPKRLIPQLLDALVKRKPLPISGSGAQRRALCFFEDSVRGLALCLSHVQGRAGPYCTTLNIGNDETRSVLEIAGLLGRAALEANLIEREPDLSLDAALYSRSFDDTWHRVPDVSRALSVLGFRAEVRFEDGIRRMLLSHAADFGRR